MGEVYAAQALGESGVLRLVAPNPSPMTEAGTNSYVLGTSDVAVIDPGPDLAVHLDALRALVAGRPVRAVLVTHAHLDHAAGAKAFAQQVGAPILAHGLPERDEGPGAHVLGGGEGVAWGFQPDRPLRHGDSIAGEGWTIRALHTPGHLVDHLSFHWTEANITFTGDTVMGWASTMISPPDGALGPFLASLDLLEALGARRFFPGHGAPVEAPALRCQALRAHRAGRTRAILDALPGAPTVGALVETIYSDTPDVLKPAARRTVLAHLLHLWDQGHLDADPTPGPQARWSLH